MTPWGYNLLRQKTKFLLSQEVLQFISLYIFDGQGCPKPLQLSVSQILHDCSGRLHLAVVALDTLHPSQRSLPSSLNDLDPLRLLQMSLLWQEPLPIVAIRVGGLHQLACEYRKLVVFSRRLHAWAFPFCLHRQLFSHAYQVSLGNLCPMYRLSNA